MVIPSWLARFEMQPKKVDPLGKLGQCRSDPAKVAQNLSQGLQQTIRQLDLTNVRPSELVQIAGALRREGLMSRDVYWQFRNSATQPDGTPRPDAPIDFLREVRDRAREVKAMSRGSGSLEAEQIYAEFSFSARGLNLLAASMKGIKVVDIRV